MVAAVVTLYYYLNLTSLKDITCECHSCCSILLTIIDDPIKVYYWGL